MVSFGQGHCTICCPVHLDEYDWTIQVSWYSKCWYLKLWMPTTKCVKVLPELRQCIHKWKPPNKNPLLLYEGIITHCLASSHVEKVLLSSDCTLKIMFFKLAFVSIHRLCEGVNRHTIYFTNACPSWTGNSWNYSNHKPTLPRACCMRPGCVSTDRDREVQWTRQRTDHVEASVSRQDGLVCGRLRRHWPEACHTSPTRAEQPRSLQALCFCHPKVFPSTEALSLFFNVFCHSLVASPIMNPETLSTPKFKIEM